MKQEEYNDMMRLPWEIKKENSLTWEKCPACGDNYCGNGADKCIDGEIVTPEQVRGERG